ncbi:hypothetical protein BJF92_24225 [Rhizobium rhizosphaerae]|uniref:Uncharacterized protein n=2 Tax=Xaviernesmea rhizosphaerae TaxID=1672749 RepID=A0A1Q9AQ23_9HYPH|nr:hypothetical protein BJF92_24225 [Xaviernesmea rhizosphaerae]OQP83843.1 hypothetical protein BTR14_21710 [Xaviernesmea rhizosphaerae]
MTLFCLRDGFTGSIRFYMQKAHVGFLWFIPDLMAFGCLLFFTYFHIVRERNPAGIFFIIAFWWSVFVSVFFMNDTVFTLFSSIKMFIPMFVGFSFYERNITDIRWFQVFSVFIFMASAIGVILNPYVDYPWLGQEIDSFGLTRQATKLWWVDGVPRYGGFAGDSTMAAFMMLFTYLLISPYRSVLFNVICWPILVYALYLTNSKTAIGLFSLFAILYLYMNTIPQPLRIKVLKLFTRLSFIALFVPPLLMVTLGGVDLGAISPNLLSLADRINNTWNGPFIFVSQYFPIGMFVGCGMGCYTYTMNYTALQPFYLPLDNFYLATFIMMGYPFLLFIIFLSTRVNLMRDPVKLSMLMLWNVYSVTVQGYGPSYATLIYGYAISEVFGRIILRRVPRQQARKPTYAVTAMEGRTVKP